MFTDPANARESRTLAQRLADGRVPLAEALQHAVQLAEALRHYHEEGRAHGALTPRCVVLTGPKLELLPGKGAITPYTAPEALEGRVDARTDVFSFGAIFYELMTGARAFEGEGAALMESISNAEPPSSGSAVVDRLVANCLSKDPECRWPRIHNVLMELKLLAVTARKDAGAPVDLAPIRAEIQQLEQRMLARIDSHERMVAGLQEAALQAGEELRARVESMETQAPVAEARMALEAVASLQAQLAELETRIGSVQAPADYAGAQELLERLAALERRAADTPAAGASLDLLYGRLERLELRIASLAPPPDVDSLVQPLRARLAGLEMQLAARRDEPVAGAAMDGAGAEPLARAIEAVQERIAAVDRKAEAMRAEMTEFHRNVAADFHDFEIGLKAQEAAAEAVRNGMAQTDDLVERVVEALESLQSAVMQHGDERAMAAAAN